MSYTPYDIPNLVNKINTTSSDLGVTAEARRQCLDAARSLVFALETPVESILRNVWAEVGLAVSACSKSLTLIIDWTQQGHHAAIRAAINLNLFEKLDEKNGDSKSSLELAKMTNADPVLMGMIFLESQNFCSPVNTEEIPRTLVKASSSDGHYLRNRPQ